MDRAYVISGVSMDGGSAKPVAGVLFTNGEPDMQALNRLGFFDIQSCEQAKPISREPSSPALYLFALSPPATSVIAVKLDWSGAEVSRETLYGEPSAAIPGVGGAAAEKYVYRPKASVIVANVKEGGCSVPVVAVLFIKPKPGEKTFQPDKKALNGLGLVNIQSVESVATPAMIPQSCLYVFPKGPSPKSVGVSLLSADGTVVEKRTETGEPHSLIPSITGSAADRYVNPRGQSLSSCAPSGFPPKSGGKRQTMPPEPGRQRLKF